MIWPNKGSETVAKSTKSTEHPVFNASDSITAAFSEASMGPVDMDTAKSISLDDRALPLALDPNKIANWTLGKSSNASLICAEMSINAGLGDSPNENTLVMVGI